MILLDLFCGLGGWTHQALLQGWECIGIDITRHAYPGRLILTALPVALEDLAALKPDLIVASPPCEQFARSHLPWLQPSPPPDLALLNWSISLIGRMPCPVIVESSRFAALHVGGSRPCGSYALWGDVPLLLPTPPRRKSKLWGRNPAARAMIEPVLADWIIYSHRRTP